MAEEMKSVDQATLKMLEKAKADKVSTVFDRAEEMKPCPIGAEGSCCKNCAMGPCRVPAPKKKAETEAEKAKRRGVCGATAETISARNFVRMIAAGTSAHSDHARGVAELFLATAKGEVPGFAIKDEQKLYQVALDLGVEIGERPVEGDRRRSGGEVPGGVREAAWGTPVRETGAPEDGRKSGGSWELPPGASTGKSWS